MSSTAPADARWRCGVCREKTLTAAGDCTNAECVQSARLAKGPYADEYARGSFNVDGSYTARRGDGTYEGSMRVTMADPAWAEAVMDFMNSARVRAMHREALMESTPRRS